MKVYRHFEGIQRNENTVLTVGTFDGVHKGHQKIIQRLLDISNKENLRAVIVTMDPHPQITLQKKDKPPISLLTNINERIDAFRQFGINEVVVITFSYEFSQTPAEEFIRDYLYGKIGVKKMLVGYDHLFGKNRSGDSDLLGTLSKELNFEVERLDALVEQEIIISSTKIRNALAECNIELANDMLGYEYIVQGKVIRGDGRGKSIGVPTANIMLPDRHKLLPGNGVYLVSSIIEGQKYFGVSNVGTRPTFTIDTLPTVEVHFFELDKQIYDLDLNIAFMKYIRPEKKFGSIDELISQINLDKIKALSMIN